MSTPDRPNQRALGEVLRQVVLEGPGETDPTLRQALAERAAGGPPVKVPYDDLACLIGEAAYRVRDEHVETVLKAAGSEKAAFEIIASAAVGAGLFRWWRALEVAEEARDASA